ncbi:hypothetical protein PACTADRAFT_51241 [Pachysolen tannophilus NRRL Y-2460]|uniref:Uncharacterized protein n=1 Tax=Pachysolen tannophilus NRRL Y-2460 TaxID=669874 RepID=A0A1E4TRL8_PACTA|nr:hypothetical protein PACTADRAFT_51241 [Pachysolen tannophilus NRRL Y-2460]
MVETQSEQSLDSILSVIGQSLDSFKQAVDKLNSVHDNSLDEEQDFPNLIKELLAKTSLKFPEGVSLLSLKNSSLLSYVNNLLLIVLLNLQRMKTNELENKLRINAIENTIVQRVTIERGVKSLENRLSYQVDKLVGAYLRMENEERSSVSKLDGNVNNKNGKIKDKGDSDEESEAEDDEDEDALAYRPDASSFATKASAAVKSASTSEQQKNATSTQEKYRPPKIAAMAPPSVTHDGEKGSKPTSRFGKLQSMEEYLKSSSDAPLVEDSIGATIVANGRGGVKTSKDKQKEEEIKRYEEENFTRLPTVLSKHEKKLKRKQQMDSFGGEDFGIFNNSGKDIDSSSSRKKKPMSSWDRAKKRRL